ncbi:MAG: hypothetical protein K6U00_08880, partial [Armatimonadetes bacterium]|nr:hypothetical protein [Armatimonadota bacterium]
FIPYNHHYYNPLFQEVHSGESVHRVHIKKSPMSGDIGRVWWLPQPPHHTEGVEYIEFLCKKHANETPCVSLTV